MTDSTHWEEFRDLQKEIKLPAYTAAHISLARMIARVRVQPKKIVPACMGFPGDYSRGT